MRSPDVEPRAAAWAVTPKEQPMPVRREVRTEFIYSGIDGRSKVFRCFPRIINAGSMRDPDVVAPRSSRPVGIEIQAQIIPGNGRTFALACLIGACRIDRAPEIDRWPPGAEFVSCCRWRCRCRDRECRGGKQK